MFIFQQFADASKLKQPPPSDKVVEPVQQKKEEKSLPPIPVGVPIKFDVHVSAAEATSDIVTKFINDSIMPRYKLVGEQAKNVVEAAISTTESIKSDASTGVQRNYFIFVSSDGTVSVKTEKEILNDVMAAYRKIDELSIKVGSNEKERINDDLELADDMLNTANRLPEGQRASEYAEILSNLNYEYDQIPKRAKNAGREGVTGSGASAEDNAYSMIMNSEKVQGNEWQKNLLPTINPEVKYGTVEMDNVKLQVILGDAKDFAIIYPEFEKEDRTPRNKEKGLVVPKTGADHNWVYNPGTYFSTHDNFAAIMSGTYLVKGDKGISYPMGGIKANGIELEPPRQSAFENKNDPRNYAFNSKYSPATMSWVSTFYIDENGRAGIKSSLDVSENERKQWPTWIEVGKTLVSGGKSTMDDKATDGKAEYRMAIVIISGKVGVITTKEPVVRTDFAKALEKIPGLEFAAQLDGSTSSQTAIRCNDGDVKSVSGRGTINLFGFLASQTVSSGEKNGKENESEDGTY